MPSRMNFRYDINGLRAWAVIAVILYHFEIKGFASGFVGVDIFFVISGYLMTRIIVEGYENNTAGQNSFSILSFYLARARRIIPALAVFAGMLLMLGWLTLTTEEYRQLGSEAFFALSFTSNYAYWLSPENSGGYFTDDETLRWFLHSWSLSVEWQFYLILPLVIGLLWKIKPNRFLILTVLASLAIASFIASSLEVYRDADLAFYSLHTRAWQMLAGGLVFFAQARFTPQNLVARMIEYIGFALIIASVCLEHPLQEWPGYRAALPIAGTVFVILANRQNSVLTNTAPAQFIGKISYSAYLWHWPIVVGLKYLGLLGDLNWVLLGMGLALVLSTLSYYLTEQTTRAWIGRRSFWIATASVSLIALLPASAGAFVRFVPDLQTRHTLSANPSAPLAQNDKNPRRDECHKQGKVPGPMCSFGGPKLAAIALGDSHSISIVSAIQQSLPSDDLHVLSLSSSGCRTLRSAKSRNKKHRCRAYNKWAITKLSEFPKTVPVIITNRTSAALFGRNEDAIGDRNPLIYYGSNPSKHSHQTLLEKYRADQISTLCEIAATRPTYVVQPIPEMGVNVPQISDRRARFGLRAEVSIERSRYDKRHQYVRETLQDAAKQCGVRLLDPASILCASGKCRGTQDRDILYYDDDHISETGNKYLAPLFKSIWSENGIESDRL